MNFVYNFHCCCKMQKKKYFVEMVSFWLFLFLCCGLYGFAIDMEEQMFFENTNLDFLDKRYPFKDIKEKSMQIRYHVLGNV